MNTCNVCKSGYSEGTSHCAICRFPIDGSEKDQVKFRAKLVMQKSDVVYSFKSLTKARIVLFLLGTFFLVMSFIIFNRLGGKIDIFLNIGIGIVFIGFGFLSFKKPKLSLLIPLCIIVLYYILIALIDLTLLWQGLLYKVIILSGLGYGFFSVWKADKILKENPYLAEQLGLEKDKKNNPDILDNP